MPDSVRCYRDSSNTFTCEVDVEPDPTPTTANPAGAPPASPVPSSPPPPTSAVVSGLVAGYRREIVGHDTIGPVDPKLRDLAPRAIHDCLSSAAGIALLAGAKAGVLGAILGLKTGLDTSKCIATSKYELSAEETQQAAVADCTASGGVVTSVQGNVVMCNVTGNGR